MKGGGEMEQEGEEEEGGGGGRGGGRGGRRVLTVRVHVCGCVPQSEAEQLCPRAVAMETGVEGGLQEWVKEDGGGEEPRGAAWGELGEGGRAWFAWWSLVYT